MVAISRWRWPTSWLVSWLVFWGAATVALLGAAALRGAEYDEAYTIFLTAGTARPAWPDAAFLAGQAWERWAGHASLRGIAADLRRTDVHPPLYFWAVALWREWAGSSLFALRGFSVACALAALGVVGAIARAIGVPALAAMLITLGCYGFTYTGAIARGFALAQLLNLLGVWLLLHVSLGQEGGLGQGGGRGGFAGGLLLGAASLTNYLASFVGLAMLAWTAWTRPRGPWLPAACGFALLLPADLWFFLAQRGSRDGQFPPFAWGASLMRLGQYAAANVFGGLPLYAGSGRAVVAAMLAGVMAGLAVLLAWHWRRIPHRWPLGICAMAPALGLLGLGVVFNTTPIELRYLSFAMPFVALLLAGATSMPRGRWLLGGILCLQGLGILGLITRPETMQPQAAAIRAAAGLAGRDGLVLLPRGNDGVGLVGSALLAASADLRLYLVGPAAEPAGLRRVAAAYPRLVLALLAVDASSRASAAIMDAPFRDNPCWREIPAPANLRAYDNLCRG